MFLLLGSDDEETRGLVDRERSDVWVTIPGHPHVAATPAADAITIALRDLPVELGFRVEPAGGVPLEHLVMSHVLDHAREPVEVQPAAMHAPGGFAAAATIYPLRDVPDTLEHLAVATGRNEYGTWTLYQTARFRPADVTAIEWANLRTGLMAHQSFDPKNRGTGVIWPARSELALPTPRTTLTPAAQRETEAKAADIGSLDAEQVRALVHLLHAVTDSDDPPMLPVSRALLELVGLQVAASAPPQASRALLRDLDRVASTQDFRAWCWMCLLAIGQRNGRTPT